jgi:hypothetical protein
VRGERLDLDVRQVEEDRQKLLKAKLQMRTVDLVICLDRTGSMSRAFPVLKEAIRGLVKDLEAGEAKRPELDRILLRVAIVGH